MFSRRIPLTPLVILALALFFIGCKTPPPVVEPSAPSAAAASTVVASALGLAPAGSPEFRQIDFALTFGNREAVASWSLAILGSAGTVKTQRGDASALPEKLSWDGSRDSGERAPEGDYKAQLSVEYGDKFIASKAESKSFTLALNPPRASFAPNPAPLPYSPQGGIGKVTVSISVEPGLAKATDWKILVMGGAGEVLKTLSASLPVAETTWDGLMEDGKSVEIGASYKALLTIRDEFGNSSDFEGRFEVGEIPGAENSSITPARGGFSPTSLIASNVLDLALEIGSKEAIVAWKVAIRDKNLGVIKTWSGDSSDLPQSLVWDGMDEAGALMAEGSYHAYMTVDYGKAYRAASVSSTAFTLATTAPAGAIISNPPIMWPASLHPASPVTFTIDARSRFAFIARWDMQLTDESGKLLATWASNWPKNTATWGGKTLDGSPIVPETVYSLTAQVEDEYGNVGDLQGSFTLKPLPPPTEPSQIAARATGFSPASQKAKPTIDFDFSLGHPDSVASWRLDLVEQSSAVARSLVGEQIPDDLGWDGKAEEGSWAPEGIYRAVLNVDYGLNYAPAQVESTDFTLVLSNPRVTLSLPDWVFSPDDDGENDMVQIGMEASSRYAKILDWSIAVLDPAGHPFASWSGAWPAAPIDWDGHGTNGDLVESASDYEVRLQIRDEFGNIGEASKTIVTGILVTKTDAGYRIRVPGITFKAYTADYLSVPADRAEMNVLTLDHLAIALARFPDYKVKLEGHAVMVFWANPVKGAVEQEEVLIPLSKLRAEAIKAALVDRGLSALTLSAVGLGAERPVVPDSDLANRWKNRRVDFYLVK